MRRRGSVVREVWLVLHFYVHFFRDLLHCQLRGCGMSAGEEPCLTLFKLCEVIWPRSSLCISYLLMTSAELGIEPALGDAASSHISACKSLLYSSFLDHLIQTRSPLCPRLFSPTLHFIFFIAPFSIWNSSSYMCMFVSVSLPLQCELHDSRDLFVLFTPVSPIPVSAPKVGLTDSRHLINICWLDGKAVLRSWFWLFLRFTCWKILNCLHSKKQLDIHFKSN